MAERSAKRAKLHDRGTDDYLPGSILEIEIQNFMTYDHLCFKPGSRLNLVVGPNGSGKSSIVCAIALGLAGEPQILGRAASVGSFVKRGEESGHIKIMLRGWTTGERIAITRKIDVHNKSEWLLNGAPKPKRDIVEVIQKFNIQVNNLTQFLPQDRVCEFAKLTPIQLLEETEKAVGDPELPVQHRALIEKSHELKRLEVSVKQIGDTLNQLKTLNAEQEKDVERVHQREKLLEKVDFMKKKLPWLKYDLKQKEFRKSQKKELEAKKKLDNAAKTLNDLSQPIKEKRDAKATEDSKIRKINNHISQNAKDRMEAIEMESKKAVQVRAKYGEVEDLKRQEESRQQRITKAKEDLERAERELADYPVYEPPKSELDDLANQILEIEVTANQLRSQRTEKEHFLAQKKQSLNNCLKRLKEMEDKNTKLLQALQRCGAGKIFEAYNWLQEHRDRLKKKVYGPVLLEVNVQNRNHAAYLESHVPNYIWKAFITRDSDDRDFLFRNLKAYDVPVLNYVGEGVNRVPFHISSEMRELGIYSRLDQVFDAPDAVKDVLISQAGLDQSYLGTQESDQRADQVINLGISDLWTPENHYRWSTSRYGGHISASMDPVHPSRLFLYNVDVGEVDDLRRRKSDLQGSILEFEESIKSLQTEQRHLEDEAAKLHKQREKIINNVTLYRKKQQELKRLVDQKRNKLEFISKDGDMEANTQKLVDEAMKLNEERFKMAIKLKHLLSESVAYKWRYAEKYMTSIELDIKIRELEANLKQYENSALQASMHHENCKKESEDLKKQLYDAKCHAESVCIITDALANEFRQMPDTVEELEATIEDSVSEANSILFVNPNILQEYQNRQHKIEGMSMKLEADKNDLEQCLAEIETLRGLWLPKLRHLVAKINETFSRNFQEMAVAGEVMLDEHEKDFDRFGILIKVKFRQTGELKVLSAHHQSGGERSVSTILYLVSLQDLTNCPFRVVDEINQGMDPINERKMFQQLVRAASQISTPQCFLLTPKLLPELEYSEACSILNIMNGPWIEEPAKVWINGGCWGEIMGLV